jgi:HEAT repeat protein
MFGLPPLPRTIEAALRDAEHPQPHVRSSALADLVRLTRTEQRERATLALIGLLRSDANADIRAEAALGLADASATGARAALLAALDDAVPRVRQLALLALGELGEPGDQELGERLAVLLDAPEPALRFQALIACDKLLPERAESILGKAMSDADDEVRAMAHRLARKRWPEAGAPAALLALAQGALDDHATIVRAAAALWLGALGDARADDVLVGVLERKVPIDTEAELEEVMDLAARRGLARARPALEKRAFGFLGRPDPLRWHARIALARLGDARARASILRGLDAWTREARTLAVVAAGRAGLGEARQRIAAFRGDPRRAEPEAVEEALGTLGPLGD